MPIQRDALLERELVQLQNTIVNLQSPKIKECTEVIYNRIITLATIYYHTDRSNQTLYNQAQAELQVLRQVATDTRSLISLDNLDYSKIVAFRRFSRRVNDVFAPRENEIRSLGVIAVVLWIALIALLQVPTKNLDENTNKLCNLGMISGVLAIAIASKYFFNEQHTELKFSMQNLCNAMTKVVDERYQNLSATHAGSMRNTFFHSNNAQANDSQNDVPEYVRAEFEETKEQGVSAQDSDDEQDYNLHVARR